MRKNWLAVLALTAALGVATPLVTAAPGKNQGKGNAHANKSDAKQDHAAKNNKEHGWDQRDGFEYRVYSLRDARPPGWSRGKKVGWRDCGLPPGQAKKYGCYSYIHAGHRYFYYHDDDARIVVRRSAIHVSASVDIVR